MTTRLNSASSYIKNFKNSYFSRLLFASLGLMALLFSGSPAQAATLALVGAVVIDGTGRAPLPDAVILIDHDLITNVGPRSDVAIPEDAIVMDLHGHSVIPGLIDLDVRLDRLGDPNLVRFKEHYKGLTERVVVPVATKALLLGGVTSARDLSGQSSILLNARRLINTWKLPGPRLRVAGPWLVAHQHSEWDRVQKTVGVNVFADLKAEVDAGVDVLVVAAPSEFSPGALQQVVVAAEQLGIRIEARIISGEDAIAAIEAGLTNLNGWPNSIDDAQLSTVLSTIRAHKYSRNSIHWNLNLNSFLLNDPQIDIGFSLNAPDVLPELIREDLRFGYSQRPLVPADDQHALKARLSLLREAGVEFGVGSGAGQPQQWLGESTVREVEALVHWAGLTPVEAISEATGGNARYLGVDAGTIKVGAVADLLVLTGDVSADINLLSHQAMIFESGIRYR